MIDLHCHSHFSDGLLSPTDLLAKAVQAEIRLLALTDHDTIDGLALLHVAARGQPITIINGTELSVAWKKHDIHILGLNIDIEAPCLHAFINRQNESRINRALQISEKMAACGIKDAYRKACEIAGHNRVGRPHFAQLFINEGFVSEMQTAFKRYLGRGRPAYAPTCWPSINETVACIIEAKGHAVLAHPLKYALTSTKLQELVHAFKEAGGGALEVVSGEITRGAIEQLSLLCSRFKLDASTGSDYHGHKLSRISLGRQPQLPVNCTPIWHKWNIEQGIL